MSIINKLLGEISNNVRFDMNSWRNLEYGDISTILAKSIIDYRQMYNLNQKELADMLGCKKSFIIKMETGQLDDISFRLLIDLWTRLSTPEFNFADGLLDKIHDISIENYEQLNKRRF